MKVAILNKKVLAIIGLAVLLIVAGYINYKLADKDVNSDNDNVVDVAEQDETAVIDESIETSAGMSTTQQLLQYEAERKIERQKELMYLDEIIDGKDSNDASVQTAVDQKLRIVSAMEHEQTITELLIAKGFNDIVVVCGQDSVNVIVGEQTLNDEQVARILNVVIEETGTGAENVKIIPID